VRKFIFDVDGTLTPSRGIIDINFKAWFNTFCLMNDVYLVTGSDRVKTVEQISINTYKLCKRVYQCAGNDVWEGDVNTKTYMLDLPDAMLDALYSHLEESRFPDRTGGHIDVRPGLVNFSVVGRGCSREQRSKYVEWDKRTSERLMIAENLSALFPEYDIQVAGETGVDITLKGRDKSQIIHDFGPHDELYFFGDKLQPNGNDYTLGLEIAHSGGFIAQVKGWEDTWERLKKL
jgi:phosphomannomutase